METGNSVLSIMFICFLYRIGYYNYYMEWVSGPGERARAIGRKGKSFILWESGTGARDGYGYWVRMGCEISFGAGEGVRIQIQFNAESIIIIVFYFLGGV